MVESHFLSSASWLISLPAPPPPDELHPFVPPICLTPIRQASPVAIWTGIIKSRVLEEAVVLRRVCRALDRDANEAQTFGLRAELEARSASGARCLVLFSPTGANTDTGTDVAA